MISIIPVPILEGPAAGRPCYLLQINNSELMGIRCLVKNTDESSIVEHFGHCLTRSTPTVLFHYKRVKIGEAILRPIRKENDSRPKFIDCL
jgi:hypothetical protein